MAGYTRLGIVWAASAALAAGTAYWLWLVPDLFGTARGPTRWHEFAALARVFVGQIGLYAAVVGPVAAHALAGRWTWGVRLLLPVALVAGFLMLGLTVTGYRNAGEPESHPAQVSEGLYGLFLAAGFLLFYLLYLICSLSWIVTRGRVRPVP